MPTITNQQDQLSQAAGVSLDYTSTDATEDSTQLGQDDFLELLTVQLQNQDPMSPMSDMDFISSMSSFSSVEAMSSLSTNFEAFMSEQSEMNTTLLETLTALTENIGTDSNLQAQLAGQGFIGKEVTVQDETKGEFTGTVERVELIDKENIDGTTEQIVGLVINDEIFPASSVTAIAEPEGIVSTLSNTVSSALQVASGII